ncbi:hypothetical protein Trco_002647 [Trichoderma cornu-damae]|uniref:Uncharacterized protein n=1 Tax=Trichoderma cornu-damae TaxID=654480 RepID=A0A9P8QQB0_9HYPO|nr:hypothetical protein Trco_002647 [Trichoderma cornu-damae]
MFNRRRRPVLGAAVLVGASRAAARHEVERQAVMDSQREMEIQREVEARRRQEAELDQRTQRAVDEAMKKAAAENQAAQQSAAAISPPPPYNNNQTPMPIQAQDTGLLTATPGQPYAPAASAAPGIQPEMPMRAPSPRAPRRLWDPMLGIVPNAASLAKSGTDSAVDAVRSKFPKSAAESG